MRRALHVTQETISLFITQVNRKSFSTNYLLSKNIGINTLFFFILVVILIDNFGLDGGRVLVIGIFKSWPNTFRRRTVG